MLATMTKSKSRLRGSSFHYILVSCLLFVESWTRAFVVPASPKLQSQCTSKVLPGSVQLLASPPGTTTNPSLTIHHAALKTRNITIAIQFYNLLGFEVESLFRAGPARAAWLTQPVSSSKNSSYSPTSSCRLELIEVPSYMLQEPDGMKRRAFDLMERQDLLGWNHVALDVSQQVSEKDQLSDWIRQLNENSKKVFGKALRIALEPRQQIVGRQVYELAFLYDPDGGLVELLRKQSDRAIQRSVESGWEPIEGTDFIE